MWAMMAAPLIAGADVRGIPLAERRILLNPRLIRSTRTHSAARGVRSGRMKRFGPSGSATGHSPRLCLTQPASRWRSRRRRGSSACPGAFGTRSGTCGRAENRRPAACSERGCRHTALPSSVWFPAPGTAGVERRRPPVRAAALLLVRPPSYSGHAPASKGLKAPQAGMPASIHSRNRWTFASGHAPSQGIVPSASREWISSACSRTST